MTNKDYKSEQVVKVKKAQKTSKLHAPRGTTIKKFLLDHYVKQQGETFKCRGKNCLAESTNCNVSTWTQHAVIICNGFSYKQKLELANKSNVKAVNDWKHENTLNSTHDTAISHPSSR